MTQTDLALSDSINVFIDFSVNFNQPLLIILVILNVLRSSIWLKLVNFSLQKRCLPSDFKQNRKDRQITTTVGN